MKILVCLKLVPNVREAKIDPVTNNLDRSSMRMVVNPSDLCGLKFALNIKDALDDTEISVLSMGTMAAEKFLRDAIQMGANKAYLLSDMAFKGSDTLATSYSLSRAIKSLGDFDLIITGDSTLDGDTGQVGPELSKFLDFNLLSFIKDIKYEDESFIVTRISNDREEEVRAKAPLLVTALKDSVPRPSKFSRGREEIAQEAEIKILSSENVDFDEDRIGQKGSPTIVKEVFPPVHNEPGQFIEGSIDEKVKGLIDILRERKVIE